MLLKKSSHILSLMLLAFMLVLFAQPSEAVTKKGKGTYKTYKVENSVEKKKPTYREWSFQFALEDEYDDDEFDGVRLSVQKMLNRHSAVKFSLGVLDKIDDPFSNTIFYNESDGVAFEFDDWENNTEEVNLSIQYMNFPSYSRDFQFYWGVGPRLSFTDSKFDPDVYVDVPSRMEWVDYVEFNDVNRIGLGVEANFGAELFLGRSFSLLAEYGFIIENRWYVFDVDYYNTSGYHDHQVETFNDGGNIDWSRLRVGMAIHF